MNHDQLAEVWLNFHFLTQHLRSTLAVRANLFVAWLFIARLHDCEVRFTLVSKQPIANRAFPEILEDFLK